MLKQHEMDLSYTYQNTDVGLEIRTQDELMALLTSLQDDDCACVVLHDRKRSIMLHIYLRLRKACSRRSLTEHGKGETPSSGLATRTQRGRRWYRRPAPATVGSRDGARVAGARDEGLGRKGERNYGLEMEQISDKAIGQCYRKPQH
jgi:hypothetical protein